MTQFIKFCLEEFTEGAWEEPLPAPSVAVGVDKGFEVNRTSVPEGKVDVDVVEWPAESGGVFVTAPEETIVAPPCIGTEDIISVWILVLPPATIVHIA